MFYTIIINDLKMTELNNAHIKAVKEYIKLDVEFYNIIGYTISRRS